MAGKHQRSFARWLSRQVDDPRYRHAALYFQRLHKAWPTWADEKKLADIYTEARRRRDAGDDVVVDHIVPLSHPHVCGLHVPDNLQIIGWQSNSVKSNKVWPDSWHEVTPLPIPEPEPYQMSLI